MQGQKAPDLHSLTAEIIREKQRKSEKDRQKKVQERRRELEEDAEHARADDAAVSLQFLIG